MAVHWDSDRFKQFGRRAALLGGFKMALVSALIGRMYYLQVVKADRYRTLAEENRISLRLLPPPRGRVVDRFGLAMAVNRQNYRVVLVPEQARDLVATLDALERIIRISEGERRRVEREVKRKRSFVPVTVRENLSWQEVARIEVNAPDLPGVSIDVGQGRYYPHGADVAHVLGYVAAVSEREQTGDPLLELPGFRIGKAGIEKVHDLSLRGTSGTSQVEVNALGRVIRELNRQEGQSGADVYLTLDLGLQKFVAERLGDSSASAVVVDIHNGDVLAMASSPGFDPNAFNKGLSTEEWRTLVGNPRAPLINKPLAGQYSPGSTFKMAVALAALEKGVISPQHTIFCPGHLSLGNARFHCWKKGGHGALNMVDAITQSCDVYFYEVARRTGIERIAAMARRLGLGTPLQAEIPGERPGLVPDKDWKQANFGVPWQQGETLIAGIGQGYILTTPLQLAVMTARLANGTSAVVPRLTRAVVTAQKQDAPPAPEFEPLGIPQSHLAVVRKGMDEVVNGLRGTARASAIDHEGWEMAGKTGTVQVRRITKAERDAGVKKNEDLPWEQRDHALFVGYAPQHAPRYAVAVVVEHGGSGSRAAAPLASDILREAQRRDSGREPAIGSVVALRGDADSGDAQ